MSHDTPELTDRQQEVLAQLPAAKATLADRLGIQPTTVEGHLNAIQDRGVALEYDAAANQWYIADERAPELRRISTKHKTSKTREATTLIEESETVLLRRLQQTDPLQVQPRETPDAESFVAVLGDLHFGDLVEDDRGQILYNTERARECVRQFGEKCRYVRALESEYTAFDDCHLILLGDIATGEGIYEGQVHDIEAHLAEQVTQGVEALYELAVTLADAFDTLSIHAVLGNHGQVRASGVSKQANTDLIIYRWLDDALRRDDAVENARIEIAESTHHLNTTIRDWSVHVRHGQDGYAHVDKTRASESKWRGWQDAHNFDLAFRGHYHDPGLDYVLNRYPVITAPSPKPGSDYVERMGSPDVSTHRHLGWCVGVSDGRPLTFKRLIDDRD